MSSADRAIVYIDGLNLYGSALKQSSKKWVDLMAVASSLIPDGFELASVKYFSADLHPRASEDASAGQRQRRYMKALVATGVEVHRGQFVLSTRWRTLAPGESWAERLRPPPSPAAVSELTELEDSSPRPMKVRVQLPEEKFTDVAIGVEIVDDFHRKHCDVAVLITNDSDLRPAIAKVVEQGHLVHVVSPAATVSKHLRNAATTSEPMPATCLGDHQLPDEFTDSNGSKHSRPNAWKVGK